MYAATAVFTAYVVIYRAALSYVAVCLGGIDSRIIIIDLYCCDADCPADHCGCCDRAIGNPIVKRKELD